MALQVWLPLDGNLTNNGLYNTTVTNTATVDNSGKIGKCYAFNGSSSNKIVCTAPTINGEASVACWAYFTAMPGASAWYELVEIGSTSLGGYAQCYLGLWMYSTNTIQVCVKGPSDVRGTATDYTHSFSTNTWYHLCATYNGSVAKLYINGALVLTGTPTTGSLTSGSRIYIGGTNSYWTKGKFNDVRIYDHCLSAEEVKRISLGLVCHLPLNRNGFGVENLLTNSNVIVNSSSYNLHDYYFVSGKAPADGETVTIQMKATLASEKTYFGIYNSGGNLSPTQLNSTHLKNGIYTRTFTWKVTNGSYTASNTYLRVYHMPSSVTATSTIDWIKLESGSEATTWSPNTSDTTYFYDWTTEKDVSGLNHNGTKIGNFSYSRNTPTYGMSTVFNGTNSTIALGTSSLVKDAITFSCWAYKTSWAQCDQRLLSCTQSGGWCFYLNNTSMQVYVGTGTSSNTYIILTANTPFTSLSPGWHLFTATYDGHKVCLYIDGILDASVTRYISKTPMYYYSPTGLFVGAEAGTDTTTSAGSYYSGNLSDVRIYATALSADDVKALYENRL